jgi:hypothetical protein
VRRHVGLLWVAVAVTACGSPVETPASNLDATGILLVAVGEVTQARPPNEEMAQAFSNAFELAEANGADIGYPMIDPLSGELILSAATVRGRELLDRANIVVPHRIRNVTHGVAELRRIQDDVTFLGSRGVPNAQLIVLTSPDHRDNRTLIGITAMNRELLDFLAEEYPPDALAVQVDPTFGGGGPG